MNKYLFVRFSSFGDIAQALPAATVVRSQDPDAEIHWLTRADFRDFVALAPAVDRVWGLERRRGTLGLLNLVAQLRRERFTHLYDAHSNLRSFLLRMILRLAQPRLKIIRRGKNRLKRLALFRLRVDLFPLPFRGVESYLQPLRRWFQDVNFPTQYQLLEMAIPGRVPPDFPLRNAVVIAPSAAWELKRWPVEYWIQLVKNSPERQFVLLAGPEDGFCDEIVAANPGRILDLRGRLSWAESTSVIAHAGAVVSGDTGLLHVADTLGKPTVAIIGPTAFGHPIRTSTQVAEVKLSCQPCTKDGRGRCINAEYKKCLQDVTPARVTELLNSL